MGYLYPTTIRTSDNYYIPVTKVEKDDFGVYSVIFEEGQGPTIFINPTPDDIPDWNAVISAYEDRHFKSELIVLVANALIC